MASVRGAFLLAQNLELAFLAIGAGHEEAGIVDGVFDLFALNEQTPTLPGMFFTCRIEGIIALDLEDVGIDGGVPRRVEAFDVFTAVYGGVGGDMADFPIPFLGGGAEQWRNQKEEGKGAHLGAWYACVALATSPE